VKKSRNPKRGTLSTKEVRRAVSTLEIDALKQRQLVLEAQVELIKRFLIGRFGVRWS